MDFTSESKLQIRAWGDSLVNLGGRWFALASLGSGPTMHNVFGSAPPHTEVKSINTPTLPSVFI